MPPVEVLLIEHSPSDILLIRECLLSNSGHLIIHTAPDGELALRRLLKERLQPHLILLDLKLPGIDGLELVKRIRSDAQSTTPVIVFTWSEDPHDATQAVANGADAVITKPPELDAFVNAVKSIFRSWIQPLLTPPHFTAAPR